MEDNVSTIEVKSLSKEFDYYKKEQGLKGSFNNFFNRKKLTKKAVNSISFSVEEGEIVGFLGPNGAGKTTTLKMLSGILYPTSGEANIMGYVPWERKNAFKKEISIVMGQKNQLWWDLPANESMYLNKRIYDISDSDYNKRIDEMAEILDVKNLLDIQVRRLSLGERMKMELMAALIHHPKVLFLDEPTIGLDIISQRKIRDFLKYYNQEKKTTILLTSHYMDDIEALCKRSIVITKGEVVFDDEISKINKIIGNKKRLKLHLSKMEEENFYKKYGTIIEKNEEFITLEIDKNNSRDITSQIFKELAITDFTMEDIPIEEGISHLYKTKTILQ